MAVNLPAKPVAPKPPSDLTDTAANQKFQEDMLKYQEASSMYNFILQSEQDRIKEESTTRTNLQKSQHDAMEAIIRNMA